LHVVFVGGYLIKLEEQLVRRCTKWKDRKKCDKEETVRNGVALLSERGDSGI